MNAPTPRVLAGPVVRGDGRGRGLGFPTANLALDGVQLPEDGIYAAWVWIDDDPRRWAASVSVGVNPTFEGDRERRVEVYLHDADLDLYGRLLRVELVALLRPTLCFDRVEDLVAQAAEDIARCRLLLVDPTLRG